MIQIETSRLIRNQPSVYNKKWRIGVHRRGGLGDALLCTAQVKGIRKKYPDSHIVGFFEGNHLEMFRNLSGLVNEIRTPGINESQTRKRYKNEFDLYFDFKPGGTIFIQNIKHPEKELYDDLYQKEFKNYDDNYPSAIVEMVKKYGKTCLEMSKILHGLDCEDKDMEIRYSTNDKIALNNLKLRPKQYITIHNHATNNIKSWDINKVQKMVDYLNDKDIKVVCIGTETPPNRCIQASRIGLRASCFLVNNAMMHIGTDGFFSHVTAAYNIPCVGLYGPTPYTFWGHSNIKPVIASGCEKEWCWSENPFWNKKCAISNQTNCSGKCMENISLDVVIQKIEETLFELGGDYNEDALFF